MRRQSHKKQGPEAFKSGCLTCSFIPLSNSFGAPIMYPVLCWALRTQERHVVCLFWRKQVAKTDSDRGSNFHTVGKEGLSEEMPEPGRESDSEKQGGAFLKERTACAKAPGSELWSLKEWQVWLTFVVMKRSEYGCPSGGGGQQVPITFSTGNRGVGVGFTRIKKLTRLSPKFQGPIPNAIHQRSFPEPPILFM